MAVLPSIPGGSSGSSQSSSSPVMINGMMGVYNQLLGINSSHYGNMLNAYQTGEQNIAQQSPQIAAGYGDVNAQVQNQLGMGQVLGQNGNWGVAAPAAQSIGQTFQQANANTTQQMTNAGLGNTTAVGNAMDQNALMAGQSYGQLGAQLAQTAAGYTAQEGNAGLASRMQGLGMQSNLYGQALGPLGQQFSNTAGALSGQQSSASSTQQAQPLQGSTQQSAQDAANNPLNDPYNLASRTAAAVGGGSGGGGGGYTAPTGLPALDAGGYGGGGGGMTMYPGGSPGGPMTGSFYQGGYGGNVNPGSGITGTAGAQAGTDVNGQPLPGQFSQVPDMPYGQYGPPETPGLSSGGGGGGATRGAWGAPVQGPGSESGDGTMGNPPWSGAKATYASEGQGANQHPVQIGWH